MQCRDFLKRMPLLGPAAAFPTFIRGSAIAVKGNGGPWR